MTKPLYYKSQPTWELWVALACALAIEFGAVSIASIKSGPEISGNTGLTSPAPVEVLISDAPPEPTPAPDLTPPLPAPPLDDFSDFKIEAPYPTRHPIDTPGHDSKTHIASAIRVASRAEPIAMDLAKPNMVTMPHAIYPYEARRMRQTGTGQFVLHFDGSGTVTKVDVVQSTGSSILDQTSTSTLRRWRSKPGALTRIAVPITYTLEGAQL